MQERHSFRLSLRIVFYREDDAWIAHCLETDVAGDGQTKREALDSLWDATVIQFEASPRWKNPANFFTPAPGRYFEMYALGADVARADMDVSAERLTEVDGDLDEIAGRVYVDGGLAVV